MVTVIKGSNKFLFAGDQIASIDSIYDGVIIKCADQTELKFNFSVPNGLAAVINIASKNCHKDITLNMDAAERNDLSHVLTIGDTSRILINSSKKEPPAVTPESISKLS